MQKSLLQVLNGKTIPRPPVWMMRQAGRYLPEYRAVRAKAKNFLDLCYTPSLAAEITLQPLRRFPLDAAIVFADILLVADALGQPLRFEEGEGPRLDPLTETGVSALRGEVDIARLSPVFETIRRVKQDLPDHAALIGFCGAPWTVATYMIAGQGTSDQAPARLFAYRHPKTFSLLIDRLVEASIPYLCGQIEAGAEAVQIFDSWAGILAPGELRRWCLAPLRRLAGELKRRHPAIPIIAFPRGAGLLYEDFAKESLIDALGLDWTVDPAWAADRLQKHKPVQGNLDPLALQAGGEALNQGVDAILTRLGQGPLIFNLGHGITQHTPIAHVDQMLERIRTFPNPEGKNP